MSDDWKLAINNPMNRDDAERAMRFAIDVTARCAEFGVTIVGAEFFDHGAQVGIAARAIDGDRVLQYAARQRLTLLDSGAMARELVGGIEMRRRGAA